MAEIVSITRSDCVSTPPDHSLGWDSALTAYNKAKEEHDKFDQKVWTPAYEADALTDEINRQMEHLLDIYLSAMDALIEAAPAPAIGAVQLKLELALKRSEDFCGIFDGHREAIIADLKRLGDAAVTPAISEAAENDSYTQEQYETGRTQAEQIAYLHVARAWMDRWKALGGNVGLFYDQERNPTGAHRGMVLDLDLWTPTDAGREDLRPHTWLTEERHHDGAVKALEGLIELVPGLRDAVREITHREAMNLWPRREA